MDVYVHVTDKAPPIRDTWKFLIVQNYNPHENATVDAQLFLYRGKTTQQNRRNIESKFGRHVIRKQSRQIIHRPARRKNKAKTYWFSLQIGTVKAATHV